MTGIIHKVAILGREFTIQTELIAGDRSTIRTLVYDGGRLVTTRELPLDPGVTDPGLIEATVKQHHHRIIDTLITRAMELQASKAADATAPAPDARAIESARSGPKGMPRPTVEGGSPLERALAVRRTIGPFALAFGRPIPTAADEQNALLDTAGSAIDKIMGAPEWDLIRLDEQLTLIAIRGHLANWRLSERDLASVPEIWSSLERFAHHLQKINHRSDLVTFDHQLLTWAISELGRDEVGDELVSALDVLRGRDAELDGLLAGEGSPSVHELLEILLGLLDRTLV